MSYRHPKDDRVHYSDLKRLAQSPAHYRHGMLHPKEPTPAMILGSAVDDYVFGYGRRVVTYDGVKNGKKWDEFQDAHQGKIILKPDMADQAAEAAKAVLRDPIAGPLIVGPEIEHQRVIHWKQDGIPFAAGIAGDRGGFDVLGPDYLLDLKTTTNTHPDVWTRHAVRMLYHCQIACYRTGARYIGREIRGCYLVGVEVNPPHCVTVLRLTDALLEMGEKTVRGWIETLRRCEDADEWPGYVQDVVDCDVPYGVALEGLED